MRKIALALLVVLLAVAPGLAQTSHPSKSVLSCRAGTYTISGVVKKGERFSRLFGGFTFTLEPMQYGWSIDIAQGEHHYLANFTAPRHGPNATDIEGWHFRNEANTGPNTGDVNAPDEHRGFFFSPKFGACMPDPDNAPGAEFEAASHDGTGTLEITDLTLGNLKPDEKADIQEMKFTVQLAVARSACEPCGKSVTKP